MENVVVKFRVYFEEPFWVGVCERLTNGSLSVCKVTFGPEPKEYEVEEYILSKWEQLRFSPSIEAVIVQKECMNPKRLQRNVRKQLSNIGMGTKSQQALKLQQEATKLERKKRTREQKVADEERMFALKQEKRKEKHKGR
jgi:Protein of unknown function (DUF2992)